jgi:hypothetical protein
MRPPPPDAGIETLTVRRLSDGVECVIDAGAMDATRFALVTPVLPSAGTAAALDAEMVRRVRTKGTP